MNYGLPAAFIIPGTAAIAVSMLVYMNIHNCPSDIGLSKYQINVNPLNTDKNKPEQSTPSSISVVFKRPFFWLVAFGYFSVAFVRFAIADWGQLYLIQEKGISLYDGK